MRIEILCVFISVGLNYVLHSILVPACIKGLVISYRRRGGGGATKCENRGSETFSTPHLKPPPPTHTRFKEWKLFAPPFNMTKSYCIKTTSKPLVPPFNMAKTLPPPPPFVGVKLHMPPPPPIL